MLSSQKRARNYVALSNRVTARGNALEEEGVSERGGGSGWWVLTGRRGRWAPRRCDAAGSRWECWVGSPGWLPRPLSLAAAEPGPKRAHLQPEPAGGFLVAPAPSQHWQPHAPGDQALRALRTFLLGNQPTGDSRKAGKEKKQGSQHTPSPHRRHHFWGRRRRHCWGRVLHRKWSEDSAGPEREPFRFYCMHTTAGVGWRASLCRKSLLEWQVALETLRVLGKIAGSCCTFPWAWGWVAKRQDSTLFSLQCSVSSFSSFMTCVEIHLYVRTKKNCTCWISTSHSARCRGTLWEGGLGDKPRILYEM